MLWKENPHPFIKLDIAFTILCFYLKVWQMYLVRLRISCRNVALYSHTGYLLGVVIGVLSPAMPKCHSVEENVYKGQGRKMFNLCKVVVREKTLL